MFGRRVVVSMQGLVNIEIAFTNRIGASETVANPRLECREGLRSRRERRGNTERVVSFAVKDMNMRRKRKDW